jgi:two-component system sensor histidine kinase/response regulator
VDEITSTFSSEDLLAMVGSDLGMLCELRDIFEEEAPRVLKDIRDAVSARNAAALDQHAHLMKNVVASVGGRQSRETAQTLERLARARDLGDTADLTEQLAAEITALREALATYITTRTTLRD